MNRIVILAVSCCAVFAGCGATETTFTAQNFIDEANANDAGLVLGAPLDSLRDDVSSYQLRFEGTGGVDANAAPADAHGGGTLEITADSQAGASEFERCENAASLVCFRAANAVVYFAGALAQADLARVETALLAMAEE